MERELGARVDRLEAQVGGLVVDVGDVKSAVNKIADALGTSSERAAESAIKVKTEIREDTERKSRDFGELIKRACALVGVIALVAGALFGPYKGILEATASGREDDARAIAAVREIIAAQGADLGRLKDMQDITRDRNRRQDDQLTDHERRIAHVEGAIDRR